MPATGTPITNTTSYPVFASKAALLLELREIVESRMVSPERAMETLWRLSNTDTSTFADPTARHDD